MHVHYRASKGRQTGHGHSRGREWGVCFRRSGRNQPRATGIAHNKGLAVTDQAPIALCAKRFRVGGGTRAPNPLFASRRPTHARTQLLTCGNLIEALVPSPRRAIRVLSGTTATATYCRRRPGLPHPHCSRRGTPSVRAVDACSRKHRTGCNSGPEQHGRPRRHAGRTFQHACGCDRPERFLCRAQHLTVTRPAQALQLSTTRMRHAAVPRTTPYGQDRCAFGFETCMTPAAVELSPPCFCRAEVCT